jgi:protein-histidine pros-kinase
LAEPGYAKVPIPQSLQALVECASEAMLIVDQSGVVLLTNQHALDLFGYAPSELEDQSVELLVPERFRLQHIGHRLGFTDDLRMRPMGAGSQLLARYKDGSEQPVEISLRSVRDGLRTLTVVAVRAV